MKGMNDILIFNQIFRMKIDEYEWDKGRYTENVFKTCF